MQGVPEVFDDARDTARFFRPAHRMGVVCYRAHIVRHAFEPHRHDGSGLGTIGTGVERFRYRSAEVLAPADRAGRQLIVFETLAGLTHAFLLRAVWPAPLTLVGIVLLVLGVVAAVHRMSAHSDGSLG